jgi:diguanylate cyclase (GGDEF)-like protein/PAS domain S-box-containing protein
MTTTSSGADHISDGAALAYFNTPKRGGLLVQAGPIFWFLFFGAVLIAAVAAGTGLIINHSRERAIQSSQREMDNTALLLARHFDRQIKDFQAVQESFAQQVDHRFDTAEQFMRQLSTQSSHDLLRTKVNESSDFAGVNVFDVNGDYINSSERWPTPSINFSDRAYFKAFQTGTAPSPFLIETIQSRISSGQAIVFARKISDAHGRFVGVVTRSIRPQVFENFMSSVALGGGASITLHHRDGTVFARFPHVDGLVGKNLAGAPLFSEMIAPNFGGGIVTSPVDGAERLVSARLLDSYPLLVVATIPVSTVLADWHSQTRSLVEAACLAAIVICVMLYFITGYLRAQHRRLDVAVNNMKQALLLFDRSERLVVCNRRYIEMFGLSPDVVKPGCKFRDLLQHRKDTGSYVGDVDDYCNSIRQRLKKGQRSEMIVETPGGRWVQVINQPLAEGGWVSTIEDVTEQRLSEQRTEYLAKFDPLTDLPNRASFLQHLDRELGDCTPERQLAVLFLDIDEFKTVNDSLGHHVGDQLLRSLAQKLQASLNAGEFIARLGGDEFAIAACGIAGPQDTLSLLQRIYGAIRQAHDCGPHQVVSDSSIGIALAPRDGRDCDQILQNADLAMYEAKSSGRRTYRFFERSMETKAKERRMLEEDLRQAIASEGLEIYYQPIVALVDNQIVGCEALVRWNHPARGFVSPADFIPLAEKSGLINSLGEYVLRKACREAAAWPSRLKLAVNVSPLQLRSDTFSLKVVSALAEAGLSASRLELEITEAVLIDDDEAALRILHELRSIGVRVALDDFGTGYSSLSYLRRFPFDKIKIDRSFIADLTKPEGSSAIIKAVVAIASERNIATTAEGVETDEQRQKLHQLGCAEMQGFLFSRPKPAADLREFMDGQTAAKGMQDAG